MSLAMYYRQYDLPWSPKAEVEQRFRRVARNVLIVFAVLGFLIPLLPTPKPVKQAAPVLPDRVVNLVLEQRKPPPPPKPLEKKVEEPKLEKPVVKPEPKPEVDRTEKAKKEAAKAVAVFDQFKDLRDTAVTNKAEQQNLTAAVNATRSERSMITSTVGRGSGGINNAALSRGYGGTAGELGGHNTTQVTTTIGQNDTRDVQRNSGSKKGKRDGSEVAQILDANKGAVFALYTRALRDNPDLQGKVVLELVIAPSGEVTSCRVVSTELHNDELERKLVARIKMIRFPAMDVESLTVTHPIEFFPAG